MMRCLPQNVAKPHIIRRSRHHWRSQHHLPKANIIQKSLICLVDKLGFFVGSGIGVFAFCEDTHSLRLTSELVDLRSGYANPVPCGTVVQSDYSAAKRKKTDHRMMACFLWQRNRDSNPNIQSQSLLCYLYTIPLFNFGRCLFYHIKSILSSAFLSFLKKSKKCYCY